MFYGHMICSLKFPCYLYLNPIVHLDVMDQIFKCAGNYLLFRALIILDGMVLLPVLWEDVEVLLCEHRFKSSSTVG